MAFWKGRSYFGGQSGTNDDEDDNANGQQFYEVGGDKKRTPSSLLKKSGKQQTDEEDGEDDRRYNYNSNGGSDYNPYNGSTVVGAPSYGGGYGNGNSPYSNGGGGYGNNNDSAYDIGGEGVYAPAHNLPPAYWAHAQDGTRPPMIIQTKEVNVYGAPASQHDSDNYNEQGRGGAGFFGPAFHAVGHFVDRRFGLHDRD